MVYGQTRLFVGVWVAVQGPRAQMNPYVDPFLCQCCDRCTARTVCRSKALVQLDPGELPIVDASRCYGCDLCVPSCPFGAIRPYH
jgi:Fe-S-cluster-containing hydrogenase component 2